MGLNREAFESPTEGKPDKYEEDITFMEAREAAIAYRVIKTHPEFSEIEIEINAKVKINPTILAQKSSEGKALVVIKIPCGSVCMPSFYREFYQALNE